VPELTPAGTPQPDAVRSELSRPRIQIPLWITIGLLATGITCSTWAWATEDLLVGLVGTGSLALFIPAVLFVERAVWRVAQEAIDPKESHA
jgi:hypothetical protein